jgi:hypothetical protein
MRTRKQNLTLYKRELALWKLMLGTSLEVSNASKKEARARETVQDRMGLLEEMIAHLELVEATF